MTGYYTNIIGLFANRSGEHFCATILIVTFQIKHLHPIKISLMQATVLSSYIFFAGIFLSSAEALFGQINRALAPVMFLTFFAVSALICGLAALAYPAWLIWEEKNTAEAVRVIVYTILWLGVFGIGLGLAAMY